MLPAGLAGGVAEMVPVAGDAAFLAGALPDRHGQADSRRADRRR